jgi:hypothetical protein
LKGIGKLISTLPPFLQSKLAPFANIGYISAEAHACTADNPTIFSYSSSIFAVAFIGILVLITLISSFLQAGANDDTKSWRDADLLTIPLMDSPRLRRQREEAKRNLENKPKSIFTAFNVELNMSRLLAKPKSTFLTDRLSILNGIRVISMFWIILG